MPSLRVFLFGTPRVEHNDHVLPVRRSKGLALLAYLAVTRQPQHRDTLATLLWPEFDDASARNNLRRELSLLKTMLGEESLVADRMQLALNPQTGLWIDIVAFEEQIARFRQHDHASDSLCPSCAEALSTAVRLQSDDFMAGFSLPDSPSFDEWQFFQREESRQQLANILQVLIAWHREAGEYDAALVHARRWLALDPSREPAHRELMRLYAWSGQYPAAVRQYSECVRLLADELGVEPDEETTELYESIKARRLEAPAPGQSTRVHTARLAVEHAPEVPEVERTAHRFRHNLPPQPSPFIGREQELAVLEQYMASPQVRLISIVGPGGMGKTRLALSIAWRRLEAHEQSRAPTMQCADGIFFVPLVTVASADELAAAIADALQFQIESGGSDTRSPLQQVLEFLRPRNLLLVLDNFEHLLAEVEIVADILHAAPGVCVLVTSRERLYLREEYLLAIKGLSFPDDVTNQSEPLAEPPANYAAVQLFVQGARRVLHDFALSDVELPSIVHICRLVEGMPLALELAAGWVDVLPLGDIISEIQRSLDFLETDERNIPRRQRSLRAVFETTWHRLDAEDRTHFMRLAIFRGGCSRTAMQAVTGASLRMVARLANKSLLHHDHAQDRYYLHELLRQYAEEQLHSIPGEAERARQAHSAYFVEYLSQRTAMIVGGAQRETIEAIGADLDNVRLAWQWVVEHADVAAIHRSAHTLALYYIFRGPYPEGVAVLEQTVQQLRGVTPERLRDLTLAFVLTDLAWLYIRIGRPAEARAALQESRTIYETYGAFPPPGRATDPLLGLADLEMINGQYAEAARLGEVALQRSNEQGHLSNRPYAWYVLAHSALEQGLYAAAQDAAQEAIAATEASRDEWYMAYMHNELAHIASVSGQYALARQHYQTSYELRKAFGDPEGMAVALNFLGRIAALQQDFVEAERLYMRSLAIYQNSGDRGGLALTLHSLGTTALATGAYDPARRYLGQALALATAIPFVTLALTIMTSAGELLFRLRKPELAHQLLVLVLMHPASGQETGERAQHLLVEHEHASGPGSAAMQPGAASDFDTLVARLMAELAI